MILEASPDSSTVVHVTAATIWYLHIGGGLIGIAFGAAAMLVRKGGLAQAFPEAGTGGTDSINLLDASRAIRATMAGCTVD
jgi:hypothetical protein